MQSHLAFALPLANRAPRRDNGAALIKPLSSRCSAPHENGHQRSGRPRDTGLESPAAMRGPGSPAAGQRHLVQRHRGPGEDQQPAGHVPDEAHRQREYTNRLKARAQSFASVCSSPGNYILTSAPPVFYANSRGTLLSLLSLRLRLSVSDAV